MCIAFECEDVTSACVGVPMCGQCLGSDKRSIFQYVVKVWGQNPFTANNTSNILRILQQPNTRVACSPPLLPV